MWTDNVDFSGAVIPTTTVTTNGQLLIGSTAAPNIRVGTLSSPDGSVTFTPGAGTLGISSALGTGRFPITPFVVGPIGQAGYQTIQAGLNAANASGAGIVYVQPGTYTENLTLFSTTQIVGVPATAAIPSTASIVTIIGIHTPPATGDFSISNCLLESATHIFSSAAAGTGEILINQCRVQVTDGYTFNLPNWIGKITKTLVEDTSDDNGVVNNTGGATINFQNSNVGTTDVNNMITSGIVVIKKCELRAPWSALTGTNATIDRTIYNIDITFSGNATGNFTFCRIFSGDRAAYTHSTTGLVSFVSCVFDSTNSPCIDGSGVGVLKMADCTFLNDATYLPPPGLTGEAGYLPGAFGIASQVLTSNGPGVNPTFQNQTGVVFAWHDVTTATQALSVSNGYFTDRGAGVTYTLPATAVLGDIIIIDGKLGLTTINQNAGQSIRFSSVITTVGVTGSAVATNLGDCVTLRCSTAGASTVWTAENFNGNWSIN